MKPIWTTLRGTAEIFEDAVLLDRGRTVHHSTSRVAVQDRSRSEDRQLLGGVRRTAGLKVMAVRAPWCLGLQNDTPGSSAPTRAIYTDYGWLCRWPGGVFRTGDGKNSSLGSYGLRSLLLPPDALFARGHGAVDGSEIEIDASEIELDLIQAAPELVVLGAAVYRLRWLANRGIIELWEAVIDGLLALRIEVSVDEWDRPVEFYV